MADKKTSGVTEGSTHVQGGSFQIAEAYKMIRTNLLFTLANTDKRTVVFSSAEPSAGKSTLCANLGIVMAQMGIRVLLVDADMRKPMQHRYFRQSKSMGLSKILGGINTADECIIRQVLPNLDLLPSGVVPPNPSELLASKRMKDLLRDLDGQYDYVFIDTPPLSVVADALMLLPESAGAVLVARQRQTTYDELEEAIEEVQQISNNLLGVVLMDVRVNKTGYSQYEKFRYYRSYNYEYVNRKNRRT